MPETSTPTSSSAPTFGPETKIFGIGLNKTGTSSLKQSWEALGIGPIAEQVDVSRANLIPAVFTGDYEPALTFAKDFRAMEDRPWNVGDMYRRLHERFDDSLFILTVRDEDDWWRSVHRWLTVTKRRALRRYLLHFGAQDLSEEVFRAEYRRYNAEVVDYFKANAPGRLLQLEIGTGGEWERLCEFLGESAPDGGFPHANRQGHTREEKLLKHERKSSFSSATQLRLNRCTRCDSPMPKEPASWNPKLKSLRFKWKRALRKFYQEKQLRDLLGSEEASGLSGELRRRAQARHPSLVIDDLAAVTAYFNPLQSRRRLDNFRRFAEGVKRAKIPLLTVELAFDDQPFSLGGGGEDVIQVRSSAVLWHKERLLNLGIARLLERGYQKIVWLDADIEFVNDGWPWRVAEKLEQDNLCQVFSRVLIQQDGGAASELGVASTKYFQDRGRLYPQKKRHRMTKALPQPGGNSGFGWAARADLLRRVPLYDSSIIGGGDKLIFLASFLGHERARPAIKRWFDSQKPKCPSCGHRDTAALWQAHYLDWAERWGDAVDGKVGYADNLLQDFHHGTRESRLYVLRREILYRQAFDPSEDLTTNSDGCLVWASHKPRLHDDVRAYFNLRRDE